MSCYFQRGSDKRLCVIISQNSKNKMLVKPSAKVVFKL